jgi:hypothetical protein
MKVLSTLTGSRFQYKEHPDGELIVYAAQKDGTLQEKSAIVITPYTFNLIRRAIRERDEVVMGASRDNPPSGSLGDLLKKQGQSPQQLSYLIPILVSAGECEVRQDGRSFVVHRAVKSGG